LKLPPLSSFIFELKVCIAIGSKSDVVFFKVRQTGPILYGMKALRRQQPRYGV
jgi:hypothetical protein